MAASQTPRHLQRADGSSSAHQIRCRNRQISPAPAEHRAPATRMDDPRTRREDRNAGADPLHLGPEGPSAVSQRRRRPQTRQARVRGSRHDRDLENDPSHTAALATNPTKDRKRPLPHRHSRILRVAMPGRYRSSSLVAKHQASFMYLAWTQTTAPRVGVER